LKFSYLTPVLIACALSRDCHVTFLYEVLQGGEPFLEPKADRPQGNAVGQYHVPARSLFLIIRAQHEGKKTHKIKLYSKAEVGIANFF
jgi:hypothetical protein